MQPQLIRLAAQWAGGREDTGPEDVDYVLLSISTILATPSSLSVSLSVLVLVGWYGVGSAL